MEIEIQKFAVDRSDVKEQASEISRLVLEQEPWLIKYRPSTYAGYKSYRRAKNRIDLLGEKSDILPYFFREKTNGRGVGIGTVIPNASTQHPNSEIGIIHGNNLDYWARIGLENVEDAHRQIAEHLLKEGSLAEAKRVYVKDENDHGGIISTYPALFATVQKDTFNPPIGLMDQISSLSLDYRLVALGSIAHLMIPEGYTDIYDIAASSELTQLYFKPSHTERDI